MLMLWKQFRQEERKQGTKSSRRLRDRMGGVSQGKCARWRDRTGVVGRLGEWCFGGEGGKGGVSGGTVGGLV